MASAKLQGWIWCNDGTSADPTGFVFTPGGIHATTSNAADVSNLYVDPGNGVYHVQFEFETNGANLKQAGWNSFVATASGARGTRGDAYGVFEVTFSGATYLFIPRRVFGYYDGNTTVSLFLVCSPPQVS
jgi:hypothetical protein